MSGQEYEIAKALSELLGDMPAGRITRQRAQHVLKALAQRVATDVRNQALLSLMDSQDMADELGVSRRRVLALARRRAVGWRTHGGEHVFTPEDVERLRPGRPGRPSKQSVIKEKREQEMSVTTPSPEGDGFSGHARPAGPR